MNAGINSLPFDIVHSVAALLDVRAYIHLGWASKGFYRLLQDENTARKCIQRNISSYSAAGPALVDKPTFRQAVSCIFDRRESLRTACPYSASVIAYGTGFLFSQGLLCYLSGPDIRILDVHRSSRSEKIISRSIFSGEWRSALAGLERADETQSTLTLLSCTDEILALLAERSDLTGHWLFALDVRDCITSGIVRPQQRGRILLKRRLNSVTKLFVRNNAKHLYVGTHSAVADHGHHEWLLQGFCLNTGVPITPEPIQLACFVGSEIGTTAAFTIHDDDFYAITNQGSFETEEVDWTSDYKYIKFSTGATEPDLKLRRIWRRQHAEGPINDAWADLHLHVDEETNDLKIVECRKEWLGGGSVCTRTYYLGSFVEAGVKDDESTSRHSALYPPNDPLVSTLDENSKPNYFEGGVRQQRNFHREYDGLGPPVSNDFIRAKTKFHSYSPEAHSFLDLVSDSVKTPGMSRPHERLRLRVASRLPKSPLLENGSALRLYPRVLDQKERPTKDREEEFYPTQIQPLWPPEHAPRELHDILCPGGRSGNVDAVSDNHALIYTAGPANPEYNNERAIVMLSFDPCWGRSDLDRTEVDSSDSTRHAQRLSWPPKKPDSHAAESSLKRSVFSKPLENNSVRSEPRRTHAKKHKPNSNEFLSTEVDGAAENGSHSDSGRPRLLWKEKAMYLSINRVLYFPREFRTSGDNEA